MIRSNPSDLERFVARPPFFGLAFESDVAMPTMIERLRAEEASSTPTPLDAVFVLSKGWAINFGDGQGSLMFATPQGESLEGWVWQDSNAILVDLLSWLSVVMPRIVCFSSILAPYLLKSWPPEDH